MMAERNDAGGRIDALDGLRGLAALAVAVFHSLMMVPVNGNVGIESKRITELSGAEEWSVRLAMAVFNGGAAVSMFFVLSGYVLMRALDNDQRSSLPAICGTFVTRRVIRIYPALAVNILVMAAVLSIPLALATENLLLRKTTVNDVTWSLGVELFAVPLILLTFLAARSWGVWSLAGVVIFSIVVSFTKTLHLQTEIGMFWFMFPIGMAASRITKIPKNGWLLVASGVALLSARLIAGEGNAWAHFIEALTSAYIILGVPHVKAAQRFLTRRVVGFLGLISYSFYLYHPLALKLFSMNFMQQSDFLPLFAFFGRAAPIAAATTIAIATVLFAIPISYIAFALIEKGVSRILEAAMRIKR